MNTTTTAGLAPACTAWSRVDTPLGSMLLARTARGLAGAWFDGQKHHPGALPAAARADADDPLLDRAAALLTRYFADGVAPCELPLDLQGSDFQRRVWSALLRIPAGATTSYGELALAIDAPRAVRAVGAAVGRNPASVFVPCHRVVGRDGSLTGYAGGLQRKQALLALEQGTRAPPLRSAA
jgi:methylated-DNA-[protein]-cysteine S-methyltransferase